MRHTSFKHLTLCLVLLLLVFGCKKIDQLTHFYMDYSTEAVLDQTSHFGTPFDLDMPTLPTFSDSLFKTQQTDHNHINQILIKEVLLQVQNPDSLPPDYIQSIKIYILGQGNADKLIAWNNDINTGVHSAIPLSLTSDDLNSYLKKSTIQYRIHGELSGPDAINTEFNLSTRYFSDAVIFPE